MKAAKSILSLIVIMVVWHLLVQINVIDKEFFPSPFKIIQHLSTLIVSNKLLAEAAISGWRLFLGTLISVPLAVIASVLCSQFSLADGALKPIIGFTYPLPKVAIIPLLMLIFGIGDAFKVAVIALGMFYLMFIALSTSLLRFKESTLNNVVKVYQIKGFNYFYHILLKAIFLDFLVGVKLAAGYGLTLVVVSEFSMSRNGIGNFIWKSWDQFNVLDMYSGIFFLGLVGFFIYAALDYIISKAAKYYSV